MKLVSILILIFSFSIANAENKIKMYFNNEEILKIIEIYSKSSGQKFIIDPSVRGKISIFLPEPVSNEEAFNHLSSALAVNGFAISKQGDTMVVKNARNIQRDLIEVSTEKPSLKPERLYTWIYTFKNVPANTVMKDLRILLSSNGEVNINENGNQLIFSDWVSNLNRVSEILKEIDKSVDPATAKLVEVSKKERNSLKKEQISKKNNEKEKLDN